MAGSAEPRGADAARQIEGVVVSGVSQAAGFVGLGWVRDAVGRLAGFDPYPGTLNLRLVDAEALARWRALRPGAGRRVEAPDPALCGGRLIPVRVGGFAPAAVIVPDVTRYGDEVVEIVAPVHLRTRLGLRDGNRVDIMIESEGAQE